MNTSKSSRQQPDPEISIKAISQAFPTLDANRATAYARVSQVRSAKSASLAREQKLLTLKHGTADHPRVQYAAVALTRNELLRREVAATREVLESPAPAVDASSFVVYGFVRRKDRTGIPGLTLALTDQQGNWLRQYGYACTDKRGYFELRVEKKSYEKPVDPVPPDKTGEKLKQEAEKDQQRAAAAAGKPAETAATVGGARPGSGDQVTPNPGADSRSSLRLRVFNADGRVLHTEPRAVIPRPNAIDFRQIILDDDDCGCTPPPEKSDGKQRPSAPSRSEVPPPAPAPRRSTAQPRVAGLKSYQNPTAQRPAAIPDQTAPQTAPGSKPVEVARVEKNRPARATARADASVEKGAASAAKPDRTPTRPARKKPASKTPAPSKTKKRSKK